MMPPILATEGITMRYGKFLALSEVSVSFARNTLTAIIGPNGAGKTTFFNVISGAFRPSFGRVVFEGRDITGSPQYTFARMGIAKSFQITSVFPHLSTHENVRVAVQMRSARFDILTRRNTLTDLVDKADRLLATVGLTEVRQRPAADLAHGQQRCLEIALALACDPKLLLLDEPTAGMSPEETVAMMELIVTLARERTVILVEHKMKLVMGICQRVIVLHHGELLAEGTPEEVRANAEVKRVYLGQGV